MARKKDPNKVIPLQAYNLVRLRKALGYTQADVAKRLNVEKSLIGAIESGFKRIGNNLRPRLGAVLGVDEFEFFRPKDATDVTGRQVPVLSKAAFEELLVSEDADFSSNEAAEEKKIADTLDPDAFWIIAVGDDMIGDDIKEGDYLLISPGLTVNSGDIILTGINGEAAVKRFFENEDHVVLQPTNPAGEPFVITDKKMLDSMALFPIVEVRRRIRR